MFLNPLAGGDRLAGAAAQLEAAQGGVNHPSRRIGDSRQAHVLLCFGKLDTARSLPEDPDDLRRFTALLLAEVKSQAMLIEKLQHQLAGHRSHRFGTSSETIEQLQLALEASEISIAKMTAKLRLPDEEKDKPKRRPIPDRIPRMEVELTIGDDDCVRCGGALRRLGEDVAEGSCQKESG